MTIPARNGPPSNLGTVLRQVQRAMALCADATPVMVGEQYRHEFGVGGSRRVLFVPDKRGRGGPPTKMGNAASVSHSCNVFVRAAEGVDDIDRLEGAYALADIVMDLVATACTGRIEWGDYADDSPTDVPAYGADIAMTFTYRRDVPHDAKRWALAPADEDTSPSSPILPPGNPASIGAVVFSIVPEI